MARRGNIGEAHWAEHGEETKKTKRNHEEFEASSRIRRLVHFLMMTFAEFYAVCKAAPALLNNFILELINIKFRAATSNGIT